MQNPSERIPERIRQAVSEELERRMDECEDYLDIVLQDRQKEENGIACAIANAIRRQADAAEVETVAEAAADAAVSVIDAAMQGLKRRPLENAILAEVSSLVRGRLDRAAGYLKLLEASRAMREHEMGWSVVSLLRDRLDACEDWITLDLVDWARVRNIVLPECGDGSAFRRYSRETLALWNKFHRTVLPESYEDPARVPSGTDALPGTWEKVDVLTLREDLGVALRSPGDAVLAEDAGLVAPQSLADGEQYKGNGKKDARTIDGQRVEKEIVRLKGFELRAPTREEEWGDEFWYRLTGRKRWYRIDAGGTETLGVAWIAAKLDPQTWNVVEKQDDDGSPYTAAFFEPAQAEALAKVLREVAGIADPVTPMDAGRPAWRPSDPDAPEGGGGEDEDEVSHAAKDVPTITDVVILPDHPDDVPAVVVTKAKRGRKAAGGGGPWLPFNS